MRRNKRARRFTPNLTNVTPNNLARYRQRWIATAVLVYTVGFGVDTNQFQSFLQLKLPKSYSGLFYSFCTQYDRCMLTRLTFKATKFNVVRYSIVAEKDAMDADRKKVADTFGNIGKLLVILATFGKLLTLMKY